MSASIIITIIVILFLAFFTIKGFAKGFLRILFTTFALIVTIIISAIFTTPLTQLLQSNTSLYGTIQEKISSYVDEKFAEKESEAEEAENDFIEKLSLPQFLKNKIKEDNTLTEYRALGVNSFKEYIVIKLSDITLKIISFIILAIVTYLLIRIIFRILRVINKIPILRGFNKLLGAALGLFEGLLVLWVICCLIMVFSASSFGADCMEVINGSTLLQTIYNNNLLITGIHAVFNLF